MTISLKNITHLAFDMDGVIYTSEPYIAEAYYEAFRRGGLKLRKPSLEEILGQIGKPVEEIFQALFPGITPEQQETFKKQSMLVINEMMAQGKGQVYPGISEVI